MTDWIEELDMLMRKTGNSLSEQERIRELSFLLGFEKTTPLPYAVMRRKAGLLYMKGIHHSTESRAGHLTNWNGWIELQTKPISPAATDNKARVIADTNADILLLQEVEDRASLEEFNQIVLPKFNYKPYSHTFVIQSNDMKGLEIAILLHEGYILQTIKTHLIGGYSDLFQQLVEYEISTLNSEEIHILATNLVNQTDDQEIAHKIRKSLVENIARIYKNLIAQGKTNVIIAGTFNTPSYCDSLTPLFQDTDVKDITKHFSFEVTTDEGDDATYYRLGAYRKGVNIKQKDYLLFSPALFERMQDSGLHRKAMWPTKKPQWSTYKEVSSKYNAASEHPLVWGNLTKKRY
ncbi:endonuclease/exonuclease/phosphatase family protein [Maribacter sp. 6B07]|uniref:endonuclease/exonuclease/phosphatase family protein n=1 Tax=Maribacter sp. 6B07 TaxID=2045442 RepID=UPI00117F59F1|nr:endonuclease/exonuclease/phosphatase family protein [Maribacter sp. 6B07]